MNIYVGSLHFKMNEAELREVFEEYGEVTSAKIIIDKYSGKSKGFGFVEMPNDAVKNRVDPVVPVEVGHSSCTVCTLGNIAVFLNRTIKWNPDTQEFVDDKDGAAAKMLHYEYRQGYSLT